MKVKLPRLKTTFICLGLFIFFLFILFPFQNFKGLIFNRIFKETGVHINSKTFNLSFWGLPGVSLGEVTVLLPAGNSTVEISAREMAIKIGIATLFPPTPAVIAKIKGLKKGGDLYVNLSQNKNRLKTTIEASDVVLEQFEFAGPKMQIQGKLNLDGSIYLDYADISKSKGQFDLKVANLKTPPFFFPGGVIPSLNMVNLQGKGIIRNGFAEIQQFQVGNPSADLEGNLSGEVRLEKLILQSHLNIKARLKFSEAFKNSPDSATLISSLSVFDPTKSGNFELAWTSSIGEATQAYFLPDALVELFNLRAPSLRPPPGGEGDF